MSFGRPPCRLQNPGIRAAYARIDPHHRCMKFATSIEGVGTGERGDRVLLDDPHNVIKIDSQGVMEKTIAFFRTSMSRGANDHTGYEFASQ
jgi:hypothetical protein